MTVTDSFKEYMPLVAVTWAGIVTLGWLHAADPVHVTLRLTDDCAIRIPQHKVRLIRTQTGAVLIDKSAQ